MQLKATSCLRELTEPQLLVFVLEVAKQYDQLVWVIAFETCQVF